MNVELPESAGYLGFSLVTYPPVRRILGVNEDKTRVCTE